MSAVLPAIDDFAAASAHAPLVRAAPCGSEFNFGAGDFERVRRLIYQRAGISLGAGKQAMVYSRLSRRLRATAHASFGDYLQWLEHGGAGPEWQEFVNCLTTNLTSFFREEHHFDALGAELRKRAGAPTRIWCNAASTGEEPYSIAITVAETCADVQDAQRVRIVASDIDTRVLASAARGVYPLETRGLSRERMHAHFLRGKGLNAGLVRVKPVLSKLIEFRQHNLMAEDWSLGEPFDIVFCRNVMIYFDAATQRRVLERMHRAMKPGALLFAGHAESLANAADLFRLHGKTIYERV
ncbi:MAG TPA: CheR family methyltransferase [Burkholderiaceae bacterium]|jgi:chemotaxis protein methyltransferase CheR|nr:CheR family methyltransferase [Burkholderiaceae bacterium]